MEYLHMEYPNFDCERFEKEVFNNGDKDPFHQRLADIRCWRDCQEYFGLAPVHVEERALKDGFMSQKLYEAFEHKIGKERLDGYFGIKAKPKLSKEEQELDDLATLLAGSLRSSLGSCRGSRTCRSSAAGDFFNGDFICLTINRNIECTHEMQSSYES